MICPVCRIGMLVIEYNKIELDYCGKCKGVWFDAGELELLLESSKHDVFIKQMLAADEACCAETKRKCPICAQKMKKPTRQGFSLAKIVGQKEIYCKFGLWSS